jgi:DNA-binding MarR family transcriptional regulator
MALQLPAPPVSAQRSTVSKPPNPGEGKRGEQGYFGYLLRQAAAGYRSSMEKALSDLDLTQPQYAIMTIANAYPGLSNAELARTALLTPQTLSVIIANLERAELVRRTPDVAHGRVLNIELTDHGKDVHRRARERVRRLEDRISEGFSETEKQAVRRWLVHLAKSATLDA